MQGLQCQRTLLAVTDRDCETGRDLAVYRRRILFADARRGIAPLLLAVPVFLAEEDLSKQS